LNPTNSFEFAAGGNAGQTKNNNLRTPILQSNSQIYNLIYTYNNDPWIIQPYFQATHVPTNNGLYGPSASSFGASLLVNYDLGQGFNLGSRVEYIGTTGNNNLLFGPGSGAVSFTLTPAYQYRYFFARAEFSVVKANNTTTGFAFGSGRTENQERVLVESGILF
jgi:hypothetical protein